MLLHARPLLGIAALAALAACSPDNAPTAITSPGTTLNSQGIGQQMRFAHAKVCPSAAPADARSHPQVRVHTVHTPMASYGTTGCHHSHGDPRSDRDLELVRRQRILGRSQR